MLFGMARPPVGRGSGKSVTPLARMHCASFSSGPPVGPAALGLPEDPHAPTSAALPTTASTTARPGRRLLRELLVLPSCISQETPSGVRCSLYETLGDTDVTPCSAAGHGLRAPAARRA
jgi:hypothetical protein